MSVRNILLLGGCIGLFLMVGCGREAPEPEKPAIYWACNGFEFAAVPEQIGVMLYLPGRDAFQAAEDVFRLTASGSELVVGEQVLACTPKSWGGRWEAARERGATFRAVGQEPGWLLELTEGGDILVGLDYGERAVSVPTPEVTLLGGARGYHAQTESDDLMVLIEDLPCFDTMSGEVFPETVTLQHNGVRYSGCGVAF